MTRIQRKLLATLGTLFLLIAGCTGLKIGYQQADLLLGWRANTYFDLDRDQRRDFSARLDKLLAWHRSEQLPEYASFLTAAIDKAQRGVKTDDIAWFVDGFRARYRIIVNRGAADATEILSTLSAEQIVHLQEQFAKDNHKFVDEHDLDESPDRQKRARLKRTIKNIEEWTGNLTDAQETKVAALLDSIPLLEHLRHQDRIRRQREFVELLKLRQSKPEFGTRLHQWLLDWDAGRAPEYEKAAEEVFNQRLHFYVAVDRLLTPEQRQHALNRLQRYADDCRALSHRPPAKAATEDRSRAVILALLLAGLDHDHA